MSESATALSADAGKVTCPACGSVHSADGGALLERSARLLDLEAAKPKLAKLQKIALRLEEQLQAAKKKPRPVPASAPAPVAVPAPAVPAPKVEAEKRESGERKKHGKFL